MSSGSRGRSRSRSPIRRDSSDPELWYLQPRDRSRSPERFRGRGYRSAEEALDIMNSVHRDRGASVHSSEVARQLRSEFRRLTYTLEPRSWRLSELRALEETGRRFRDVLGSRRGRSRHAGIRRGRQNVRTFGALNYGPGDRERSPDRGTRGETFRDRRSIAFFYPNLDQTEAHQQRTSDHEMAHSELQPEFLPSFERRRSRSPMRHEPATSTYGSSSSREDFAETIAHHLSWPGTTATNNPERSAFAADVMQQVRPRSP